MLGCFRNRYLELRGNLEANRFTGSDNTEGVRLIFLEESDFGLTMIGESSGPGMHTNLGYGPEPSREAMWDVMNSVVDVDPR